MNLISNFLKRKKRSEEIYDINYINQEKLKLLFQFLPISTVSNLFVGIFFLIFLNKPYQNLNILIWLSALFFISATRILTYFNYKKNKNPDYKIFYRYFSVQMIFSASLWGVSGYILFVPDKIGLNMLIMLCIAGIAVGAIISLASDKKLIRLFLLVILIPTIIRLFLFRTSYYHSVGTLALIYYISITTLSNRIHILIFNNIIFTQKYKDTLEELTVNENKFRTIFESVPIGIFYYNKDLVISDCNDD